jgi:hypothetical protein
LPIRSAPKLISTRLKQEILGKGKKLGKHGFLEDSKGAENSTIILRSA